MRWSSLTLLRNARISFQLSFQRTTSSCLPDGTKSVLVLPSTPSATVILSELPTYVRVTVPSRMRSLRHSVLMRETSALRQPSVV